MSLIRAVLWAGFAIASWAYSVSPAWGDTLPLTSATPVKKAGLPEGSYAISVNPELAAVKSMDRITVTGSDGDRHEFIVQQLKANEDGGIYVSALDQTGLNSLRFYLTSERILHGRGRLAGREFLLNRLKSQQVMTFSKDAGLTMAFMGNDVAVPPLSKSDEDRPESDNRMPASGQPKSSSSGSVIGLAVVYEPQRLADAEATANFLINYTNEVYQNSGIHVTFELVDLRAESSITSLDDNTALNQLTNASWLPSYRESVGADMVTFLRPYVQGDGNCGIAWIIAAAGGSYNTSTVRRLSVSVTNVGADGRFFCSDLTLAHELGHNFGAQHNRSAGGASPFYNYAHGEGVDGQFATVMSLQSPEVPLFSTPLLSSCNGFACGVADFTDVARAVNNVRAIYASTYDSRPQPPSIVSLTPAARTISVSFTPGSDGGSAITSFSASCGGASAVGANSPIVVENLTPDTTYACTVRATNGIGQSDASPSVSTRTLSGVPAAPVITAVESGDEEIFLRVASAPNSEAIDSYQARCTDGNNVVTATSASLSILVPGLSNGVSYTCSVTATNAFGTSAASASSAAVVPEFVLRGLPSWFYAIFK